MTETIAAGAYPDKDPDVGNLTFLALTPRPYGKSVQGISVYEAHHAILQSCNYYEFIQRGHPFDHGMG